ncbi:MAG: UDP-N-acetylglucosamine 1-carboxyvinyltransferase, partial [Candidatus Berkelbacteria bacterium]|nr:UDP-N-acetylglucosamine 1-carboxyvinyltransferase [Candidatus Berkelbacteria bacterium]
MASFEINGVTPLVGKVRISGSKNEALKLIPLSIVLKSKVKITNVPEITDVFSQIQIAKQLGVKTSFENGVLTLESSDVSDFDIKSKFAKKLRASIVFLGPLLARFKKVKCRYPGGCVIGSRSIETHTDAFKQLGAKVNQNQRNIEISLDVPKKCAVNLKEKSVSATENIFLYASAIESEITISNCAVEPEVIHLSKILEKAGAKFDWINDRKVTISGTTNLKLDEIEVISDRIEAGTFLIGLIATGGEGEISNFPAEYLDALISILKGCGAKFKVT